MFGERPLLELVRAELERAQQLVAGLHPAPLDPQFLIASPQGERRIAVPLAKSAKERGRRLALVSDFMAWTAAPGFILTTEFHAPHALVSVGLHHEACAALISAMQRAPLSFEPAYSS